MSEERKKTMVDRLLSAFWVPVSVLIATAAIIAVIGELLLWLAHMKYEIVGVKEPYAVLVALILAGAILVVAAWLARNGRGSQP